MRFASKRWQGLPFNAADANGNYAFIESEENESVITDSKMCKINDKKGELKGWIEIRKVEFGGEVWEFYVDEGVMLKQTKLSPHNLYQYSLLLLQRISV